MAGNDSDSDGKRTRGSRYGHWMLCFPWLSLRRAGQSQPVGACVVESLDGKRQDCTTNYNYFTPRVFAIESLSRKVVTLGVATNFRSAILYSFPIAPPPQLDPSNTGLKFLAVN